MEPLITLDHKARGKHVNLFAISDLHLSGGQEKPMKVFGACWDNHPTCLFTAWRETVDPVDFVLVPGDISWAMRLNEVACDLASLGELPGHIVISRGNHDYWWQSLRQVREALPPNMFALQNDCLPLAGSEWVVCGTRGWQLPEQGGANTTNATDKKIYERELMRLEMSLQAAKRIGAKRLIAMMHFPPAQQDGKPTGFTSLLERYEVEKCVYGHLHGEATRYALHGNHRGVTYQLVSADFLNFKPLHLASLSVEDGAEQGFSNSPLTK